MELKSRSITHLTWNKVSRKHQLTSSWLSSLHRKPAGDNSVITDIEAKIKEFKTKQISRKKKTAQYYIQKYLLNNYFTLHTI